MKTHNILSGMILGMSILLTSCYQDLGNYDYLWIKQAKVEGLRDTIIEKGDILHVDPLLDWSDSEVKPDELTYTWFATKCNRGAEPYKEYVIGRNRILNDTIWLDIRKEPYLVTLKVRDEKQDIEGFYSFKLIVEPRIAEGFLFLTENKERKVELDIYACKSTGEAFLEKGVLGRSGFPYPGGGANCVFYKDGQSALQKQLWIVTGEAAGWLELSNLSWAERNLAKYLFVELKPLSYTFKKLVQPGLSSLFFFTEDGYVHQMDNFGLISPNVASVGGARFRAFPGCATDMLNGGFGRGSSILIYDQDKKKFQAYNMGNECVPLPANESAEGMELIFMQTIAMGGRTIALMKDPDGNLWQYNYELKWNPAAYKVEIKLLSKEQLVNTGNMEQAREKQLFICDNLNGFIYYAIGNQLYNYRKGEGAVPVGQPFDGEITCFYTTNLATKNKPLYYPEYNKSIIVTTYSEQAGGKAYLLQPDPVESKKMEQYGETIEGLGMVKSISFLVR